MSLLPFLSSIFLFHVSFPFLCISEESFFGFESVTLRLGPHHRSNFFRRKKLPLFLTCHPAHQYLPNISVMIGLSFFSNKKTQSLESSPSKPNHKTKNYQIEERMSRESMPCNPRKWIGMYCNPVSGILEYKTFTGTKIGNGIRVSLDGRYSFLRLIASWPYKSAHQFFARQAGHTLKNKRWNFLPRHLGGEHLLNFTKSNTLKKRCVSGL